MGLSDNRQAFLNRILAFAIQVEKGEARGDDEGIRSCFQDMELDQDQIREIKAYLAVTGTGAAAEHADGSMDGSKRENILYEEASALFARPEDFEADPVMKLYLEDLKDVKPLDEAEQQALLLRHARGDGEADRRLIEGHLIHALMTAAEFADKDIPMQDLIQESNMGLMQGVMDYKAEYGHFESYLKMSMISAMDALVHEQDSLGLLKNHLVDTMTKVRDLREKLPEVLGHEPSNEELAEAIHMDPKRLAEIIYIAEKQDS